MSYRPWDVLENRIQLLVEGSIARLFAGRLHPQDIVAELVHSIEDGAVIDSQGRGFAPEVYAVRLNPADHREILKDYPQVSTVIAEAIVEIARSMNLALNNAPEVKLLASTSVAPLQVSISASLCRPPHDSTKSRQVDAVWGVNDDLPLAARLVLADGRSMPIDRAVLNIGRHRSNHLILDDPLVSRHHAQIRLRGDQFILFDLASTQGTRINGEAAKEAFLKSGDVLQLGSTTLIFLDDGVPSEDANSLAG